MANFGERLRKARKNNGLNQADLARKIGTGQASVSDWENNVSKPRPAQMKKLLQVLAITHIWLEFGENTQEQWDDNFTKPEVRKKTTVNLVGAIGAGGHINPIDDHANGAGLEEVEAPPDSPKGTVAVVVRGNSLYPSLKDGSLIYYSARHKNVIDYLHEMVICHFTDGRKAVKVLTPGTEPGTFTLTSVNAPPMINEAIESVSPIDWMRR